MLKKRSVASVIILSIITCGIYGFYWIYVTAQALQSESGTSTIPPVISLLLTIFVSPVGFALFGYDCAVNMNAIREKRGLPAHDDTVLYIILGVIIAIVQVGIIQHEVNNLAD